MTLLLHDLAWAALVGLGATALFDLWGAALRRAFGLASLDMALLGRWAGHLARGRLAHAAIARAAPVRGERALGWAVHYGIGVAFAGLLLALAGLASLPRATRRAALPGLAFALIYAALSFGWHAKFFRYLAPLLPVILVLAGIGAARLIGSTLQSLRVAGMTGLGLCLIAGIDFASGYRFADPRLLAETAIARLTGPADPIAIEPHDLGLTAGRPVTVLPLDDPGATPETLAQALSGGKAMLIASRRNWAVLPGHPATAALTCGFYAALARGDLGFRLHRTFTRQTLFGPLFAPGPGTEETATVFDRPTVLLLLNEAHLPAAEIAARIAAPADPATCTPVALQAEWDRPR